MNIYHEEDIPIDSANNALDTLNIMLKENELPFTLKTVHIPVIIMDSTIACWEVVKLIPASKEAI